MSPIEDKPSEGSRRVPGGTALSAGPVSPRRLLAITVALVFAAELLIMICLELLWQAPEGLEVLVDAVACAVVMTPLLYWNLYRPLNRYVLEVERGAEELGYSEEKYHTVVESSPAGIFIYRDGRIVFANRRLGQLLGYAGSSPVGLDPLAFVAEEDRDELIALMNPAADPLGNPRESEFRLRQRDGSMRWVSARSSRVRYRGSDSVLGMVLDISLRKHLTEELRNLSAQRLHVQEEERARVARELHDGVGQSLSAIKFLIEHTLGHAFPNERRENVESLRELVPKIQDAVEEVRRISMALRPSTLDDLGLLATITWFLRDLATAFPHVQVEHVLEVGESQVPDPLKIAVYRTLQEAMNNAAKHGGECRVRVSLVHRDGALRLTVEDDGDGFDPVAVQGRPPSSRGFGLASMRERVQLSGGAFALQTAPGEGTRVQAVWPVADVPATAP